MNGADAPGKAGAIGGLGSQGVDKAQRPCHPCEADQAAIDAMVESGWDVLKVDAPKRDRASRAFQILRAAAHPHTDDQTAARMVDATMSRLESSTLDERLALTPNDEEAVDAWLLAEYRVNRVPGSLRERAAKLEAFGQLITSVPGLSASSMSLRPETTALVEATLKRLEAAAPFRTLRVAPPSERSRLRTYKLGDLISVAAVLTLGTAVVWPMVAAGRSRMQQVACRANMGEVATAMGLYAGANRGRLPMATASLAGLPWWEVGTPAKSNSANLYTLARNQYTLPETLACDGNPGCRARVMTAQDMDWQSLNAVSYSFRVMFGGRNPRWEDPSRVVVLADKSPVVRRAVRGQVIFPTENSPNHGGLGQNVLTLDGSAKFLQTPMTADGDNIWLPRGLETALAEYTRRLRPGQTGLMQVSTWQGPTRTEPIKGIETPEDERDSFVGP